MHGAYPILSIVGLAVVIIAQEFRVKLLRKRVWLIEARLAVVERRR